MARKSRNREYCERLERVLSEHGITEFGYVEQGHAHMALVFQYRGKTLRKTVPSTPGDKIFGPKRAAADLRRILRNAS